MKKNEDLLFYYLNQISNGDVLLLEKTRFSGEYNKFSNKSRIKNIIENGVAVRSYSKEKSDMYFSHDLSKYKIDKLQKTNIINELIPKLTNKMTNKLKKENSSFGSCIENISKLSNDELIYKIKLIEKESGILINDIKFDGLDMKYDIANTNGVNGSGRINYINAILDMKIGNHFMQKSYLTLDAHSDLFDIILKDKTIYENNKNNITIKNSFKNKTYDFCILSHGALFELVYLLCYFLYDYNVINQMSIFNKENFKKLELECPLTIVENSYMNEFVNGTTDFTGFSLKEKYIIKNGKINATFGSLLDDLEEGSSKFRGSITTNAYTKMLKSCLLSNEKFSYMDFYNDSIVIESFSGLYESINPKTLDFNCRLIISSSNFRDENIIYSRKISLNLLDIFNSITSFDNDYKYVGDGGMLVPCAKLGLKKAKINLRKLIDEI